MSLVSDKLIEIFESIIKFLFDSLIEPFTGLSLLKDLVYGKSEKGELVWGTFRPSDLTDGLSPLYYTMLTLTGFLIVSLIVIAGMRIAGAPLNPSRRNETIEFFKDLLLVGIVLFNLPTLYDLLFTINQSVTNLFGGAYESNLDKLNEERSEETSGVIGYIFIQLILVGLTLWANFYYLMRKVTLLILMALGPIMMAFWLNPKTKEITGAWFKELIGSIAIQSIHAFVFWTIAILSATSSGFIETVIVYLIFIPISESVRRLIPMLGGDMQGGLAKAGSMLGMAGLSGMYGAVKGSLGDKSVMGALKGAYSGVKDKKNGTSEDSELKNTIGATPGGDNGTTTLAEKMLKAGEITSKAGKAVFGMAGSIAGSPLGPVGAMIGATAGSELGGAVGGAIGRGGAAGIHGLQARHQAGQEALLANADKLKKQGDFSDSFANEIANRETASWADENRDSVMAGLRERFPDASESELAGHYQQVEAQKRAGFHSSAKANFAAAQANDGKNASGSSLVSASSNAMANQWANDNLQSFNDEYSNTHPQQAGESDEAFATRRNSAFLAKKGQMRNAFAEKGRQIVSSMGADAQEPISMAKFNDNLSSQIGGIPGVGNVDTLSQAASEAVAHVQGASVLQPNGKPNALYLASQMASAKTKSMGQAFIQDQMSNGMSKGDALEAWNQNKESVHQANLGMYKDSAESAGASLSTGNLTGLRNLGHQAVQYVSGASGLPSAVKGLKTVGEAVNLAGMQATASYTAATSGMNGIASHIQGFMEASSDSYNTGMNHIIDRAGGAVQAQNNIQNGAGYVAGALFGATGYKVAKSAAARFSPLKDRVQEAIYAPSEVLQMAQTTIDDNGNKVVAPGAIRQVTTPNESYIEVRTKTGSTQVVSRLGSGHSGMSKGDVVYQDLDMQGDRLVASPSKNGQSSTYRLDSGGAKVPSSMVIASNPNELLGSPRISDFHKATDRPEIPSYSQFVDNGNFFLEDLKTSGMGNVQVILEKDRQYVTAQKDGMTYRVSPYYAGDTRMNAEDSRQIPMKIHHNVLKPANPIPNSIAVQSALQTEEGTLETEPYYSSQTFGTLLPSRDTIRVQKTLSKRQQMDVVRRKQGLLG
ncbi:type IV secretion system protein [Bacillus cihuensis]|uniref:type IV secretion system protein n=1 Tax=Bacillus cihuensis TaxID=1208599 RepID=UPI00042377B6|nr:type IV secretion system protein [Bacillus cihuensis]